MNRWCNCGFDDCNCGGELNTNLFDARGDYRTPEQIAARQELTRITAAITGLGKGPTRATTLPTNGDERKQYPIASGVFDYFPDALVAIAHVSYVGNEQHNPGQLLHWDRAKSTDEPDTLLRHFAQRGTLDIDGLRHTAKLAWRALALLQKEIEGEK